MEKGSTLWLLDLCVFGGISKNFFLNAKKENLEIDVVDTANFNYDKRFDVFDYALSLNLIEEVNEDLEAGF